MTVRTALKSERRERPDRDSDRPTGNVLVSYEPTRDGSVALSVALALAAEADAALTIAAAAQSPAGQ